MCLGAVFVLGGVGMAVSQVSSAYPNLCKLITGWVKTSLPEDTPSALQIRPHRLLENMWMGTTSGRATSDR